MHGDRAAEGEEKRTRRSLVITVAFGVLVTVAIWIYPTPEPSTADRTAFLDCRARYAEARTLKDSLIVDLQIPKGTRPHGSWIETCQDHRNK